MGGTVHLGIHLLRFWSAPPHPFDKLRARTEFTEVAGSNLLPPGEKGLLRQARGLTPPSGGPGPALSDILTMIVSDSPIPLNELARSPPLRTAPADRPLGEHRRRGVPQTTSAINRLLGASSDRSWDTRRPTGESRIPTGRDSARGLSDDALLIETLDRSEGASPKITFGRVGGKRQAPYLHAPGRKSLR
jgi:hypothetical protein